MKLWENYAKFSEHRGQLVVKLLKEQLKGGRVLDIGAGHGGTSLVLAHGGFSVTAIDLKLLYLQQLKKRGSKVRVCVMRAQNLGFRDESFNAVILQDLIEHTPDPEKTISEMSRVLKKGGVFYMSTPNRLSPLNLISDPHWGLPFLAPLSKRTASFLVTKVYRREKGRREDSASLLSLFKIRKILKRQNLLFHLVNRRVVQHVLMDPYSVLCKEWHLKLLRRSKPGRSLLSLVNDDFGIFNYFFNPTWYILGRKP